MLLRLMLSLTLASATQTWDVSDSARVKRADDVTLASLQSLLEQHTSVIQTLQSELTAAKTRVQELEAIVRAQQARIDFSLKAVAFSARFSQDDQDNGISLGAHQTAIFDQAVTNVGQAYSTTTGIFTAPVAGSYAFFLSQMSANAKIALHQAIVKNGQVLDMVFTEGSSDFFDQGSSQVTTHLVAGDQVWVRQEGPVGSGVRGSFWTIFTGYLLHADST